MSIYEQETAEALSRLSFVNRFTRQLPGDPETRNFRRTVNAAAWSSASPAQVAKPHLIAASAEMLSTLDLPPSVVESQQFAEVFSGNSLLPGMEPFAMCYGGHQFGNWAGQLGDGRAINLGEVRTSMGEHWTLQLKGAGPTPYSRTADGLAVLRSSVREFLCSEAMFHLGIPTSRALCLVGTGESVMRDMFYDGHPAAEPGAIVCRVAQSFLRFGNFEIFAARRDDENLRRLIQFCRTCDFGDEQPLTPETCVEWFAEVCRRTAVLIVHWMRVGFVHGVMNTDNMSILGLTLDYGPYGWLEGYDPHWTPNTTDADRRRYCFGAQPEIALWNLVQLANAIVSVVGDPKPLQEALSVYTSELADQWHRMMAGKLGIGDLHPEQDSPWVEELQAVLPLVETDMTLFFRGLGAIRMDSAESLSNSGVAGDPVGLPSWLEPIRGAFYQPQQLVGESWQRFYRWLVAWRQRVLSTGISDDSRKAQMDRCNPRFVLRNYLAQEAIDLAGQRDFSRVQELLDVMRQPYAEQPGREQFALPRPEWARHRAGCSMLSCSS